MNDDNKAFDIKYTKDYVSFLLSEHFDETYLTYLDLLEKNIPDGLKTAFKNRILNTAQKSYFKHALTLIIDNYALNQLHQFIHTQFSSGFPGTINNILKAIYSTLRQLLIKVLPVYTTDFQLYTLIINELEEYFVLLEKILIWENKDLHLQNEFLYSIINSSIDGIAAFDKELRVLEWNEVLENHHKIKKADILGRKIQEAIPEYNDSEEIKSSGRVLNGEKLFLTNQAYKTKQYGWYDAFMAPIYDEKEVKSILCIFRDVTKRKENEDKYREQRSKLELANKELKEQREEIKSSNEELQESLIKLTDAQEALKENEARLIEAQAVAHLGSWEYDLEKNNIFWSDELKRIFGYSPNDNAFDYETYLSLIHPEDQEMINLHVKNTFSTFEPYSIEHRIIKNDGKIVWIQAVGKAVVVDNKVVKLKGIALDITERKISEEKLRQEQHFIQKIADTTPNVITVFDLRENKNIYHNKELYALLSCSENEFEHLTQYKDFLKQSIHPEDLPRLNLYLENFKKYSGNDPQEIEYRIKDFKGNQKWITSRHSVFKKSEEGYAIQIIGISRDITEKKESEIQLIERESKLKESQRLAKLGHWELDLQTKSIIWSEGLYDIYGIEYGTSINLDKVKTHIITKDYKELLEVIQKAVETKNSYTIEYRIKHSEKGIKTLFSRGTPVFNDKNEVIKLKGITQDITNRKKIEHELKESQNFINAITESVPNIIFVYDVINNKGVYANRELGLSLGYSAKDIKALGKNLMKTLVHKDDYQALMERNERVKNSTGDEIFEVFIKIKHANGEWRWLRSLSKIFRYNSEGLPWQILGVTEDVTDKKHAEEKLQTTYKELQNKNNELAHAEELLKIANNELEARVEKRTKELSDIIIQLKKITGEQRKFTALVEKSINFISMADVQGNIIYLNEGGMRLVGITSKEEALKTKIQDYFLEEDLEIVFKKSFDAEGYSDHWKGEFRLKHFKTGKAIPVFSNAFRIEDPTTGEILALANVSHDLTDQKKKEEEIRNSREKLEAINLELNKKNEELLKINIDLDNFVYTASHDLKSPISNLEGLLLAINKPTEEKLNDQEKQIIKMMGKSVFKLKDTINALVEITKAQRNLEESREVVSIPEVLNEVVVEIERLINESKAEIFTDIKVEEVHYAKINLHSIIYNLLSNAIKYRDTNRPVKIYVSTFEQKGSTVLKICDNGMGISAPQQAKLFGMFRRFHSHVEGTGIGLYIIKRVVENNNGRIEVQSEEGKGTCFNVYFYS